MLSGAAILAVGAVTLIRAGRAGPARVARLGWQVEALGTALLGIGWVLGLVASGLAAR
jgi:hypothetical protein